MRTIILMLLLAAVSTASAMDLEDRTRNLTTMAPTDGWWEHI